MTDATRSAVREAIKEACDTAFGAAPGCDWPSCGCGSEKGIEGIILATVSRLLAAAKAEERESAAKVVDDRAVAIKPSRGRRLNQVDQHTHDVLKNAAAAIRSRAPGGGG